ncbi:GspH/FimT family pseudopilin [Motilimonas pumila]|uniref:Type II secretion system protein H n=1 Tax=Motilimonas pumila TaxID=2303987 RepID=A0A418YG68_9GAMM|nr:GspH/FimT family pseudopilin [Motilimonas pumila]RJG48479.1 prepilin-type N-terminal cleavage/methylation domain-containing protein [Motilimonas pumila]
MKHIQRQQLGFNLIELMVVIAIVMILTLVAIPSYQTFVQTDRMADASNNLYNAFRFARSEAVKTSSNITLKAIDSDWAKGWRVVDAANKILMEVQAPHQDITVTGSTTVVKGNGGLSSAQEFTVSGYSETKRLCIYVSGQSKLQAGACS